MRTLPGHSGNDVVGAATMPPEGAYVSALRVIAERSTVSCHMPSYRDWRDQCFHHFTVRSTARKGSMIFGGFSYDGNPVSVNGTFSPARTVNSALWRMSAPSSAIVLVSRNAFGPATIRTCPSMLRTQGTTVP